MVDELAAKPIRCPRCGYDQRGVIVAWDARCPLEGRCTECGLTYWWAEVLRPDKFEPQWCVEHAPGLRGALRGVVSTLRRSLWPFGFFRELKMSDRTCPWRQFFYLFVLVLAVVACYAVSQSLLAVLVRARIESLPAVMSVQHPYPAAVFEAVTAPFGRRSAGLLTTTSGVYPYPAPRKLPRIGASLNSRRRGWLDVDAIMPAAFLLVYGTMLFVLVPASFILLPVSRRRGKVRWAHVRRVAVYSLALPLTAAAIGFLLLSVGWLRDDWFDTLAGGLAVAIGAGLPLGLICWWAAAIKRYLHIPHAWLVAVSLTVLGALLAPVIAIGVMKVLDVGVPVI